MRWICHERSPFSSSHQARLLESRRKDGRPDHAQYGRKDEPWSPWYVIILLFVNFTHEIYGTEAMLSKDPFVHGAMIFGRGRFHAGVLVQPKVPFEFDSADQKKVVDFRNLIW